MPLIKSIIAIGLLISNMVSASTDVSKACALLSTALPDKVFTQDDTRYAESNNAYFFANAVLSPRCIIRPESAQEVSTVLKTLAKTNVKIAIRGGGHTPNPGAANIDGGVTIAMDGLNSISFSTNNTAGNSSVPLPSNPATSSSSIAANSTTSHNPTVLAGAGATFGAVYAFLDPHNLIAVGGRGESLGLGGLLTGGGVGFFGPKYGFACDNVVGYEVVLANGTIVNSSLTERVDLFMALKGGSNNFGIVTRFELKTYPQDDFWGGFVNYPGSTIPALLDALGEFMTTDTSKRDPSGALIASFGYVGAYGMTIGSNGMHYTKSGVTDPEVFKPFTSIEPKISSSLKTGNLVDFVGEIESMQSPGSRETYVTTTFSPSPTIFTKIHDLWSTSLTPSLKSIKDLSHFLVFQNFPTTTTTTNLQNPLGLSPSDTTSVILVLSVTWSDRRDDALVESSTKHLLRGIEEATRGEGMWKSFKHLNYAAGWQDPVGGYGEGRREELRRVSGVYDPEGFFQRRVVGGFKLT